MYIINDPFYHSVFFSASCGTHNTIELPTGHTLRVISGVCRFPFLFRVFKYVNIVKVRAIIELGVVRRSKKGH